MGNTGAHLPPIHLEIMKDTSNTSAKCTRRRYERNEHVCAGVTYIWQDWQCHICSKWYSKYRSRHILHLQHCEAKEARRVQRKERRRAQTALPLPSPDRFSPYDDTLDTLSTSHSPAQELLVVDASSPKTYPDYYPDNRSIELQLALDKVFVGDGEIPGKFNSIATLIICARSHSLLYDLCQSPGATN